MAVVAMNYLLEAGAHFGHQTKRWNPKMKEYIFTTREGIYIMDLQKTVKKIEEAYSALTEIVSNGGKVIYVGTKKQASEVVKEEATRSGMYYVAERWLGGTLTNFNTIRRRVNRMIQIEKMEEDGTFDLLPKKEVVNLRKEYDKLNKYLAGIREMNKLPQAMIIVDTKKEYNAIAEAKKLNIPVFGLIDTNCDPDLVDYVLPANDDAVRSIKVVLGVLTNAVVAVNGGEVVDYITEDPNKKVRNFKNDNNNNNSNTRREYNNSKPNHNEPKVMKKEVVEKEEVIKEKEIVVEEVQPEATQNNDLKSLTVKDLRELAKEKNIKGVSTMKKEELLEILSK